MVESGKVWQRLGRSGTEWQGVAEFGKVWQSLAKCGKVWQSLAESGTQGNNWHICHKKYQGVQFTKSGIIGQTIRTWIHTSCRSESSHIILVILDNSVTVKCQSKYTFQTMRYEIHYFSVENSGNLNDSDRHIVHLLKLHSKK